MTDNRASLWLLIWTLIGVVSFVGLAACIIVFIIPYNPSLHITYDDIDGLHIDCDVEKKGWFCFKGEEIEY